MLLLQQARSHQSTVSLTHRRREEAQKHSCIHGNNCRASCQWRVDHGLRSSLPLTHGGVGLVHVPTQIQALQAKVISRLLEPERLAWKVFQLYHLSRASQVQPLGYGASILFSTLSTDSLQLPARLSGYVAAFFFFFFFFGLQGNCPPSARRQRVIRGWW